MTDKLLITRDDIGNEFVTSHGKVLKMTEFVDYDGYYPVRCVDSDGDEETYTENGEYTYDDRQPDDNIVARLVKPETKTIERILADTVMKAYDDHLIDRLIGVPPVLSETKPSNPKDSVGISKVPMSTVPATVLAEVGVAMAEGARKYGRHNYRVLGCKASVYYDATMRHLMDWWEGTDIDADSGMSHVTKAITSLVVLRDAMIQDKFIDDRPPVSKEFLKDLNVKMQDIINKYPESAPTYTKED